MKRSKGRLQRLFTIVQPVLLLTAAVWFMVGSAEGAQVPGGQKRVLLLYDGRSDMAGNIVVDRTIRSVLRDEFDVNLDVRSEYFEVSADPELDYRALLNWLTVKYAGTTFDVVVAVGPYALQFASAYGRDLFRGAQVVYWGRKAGIRNWESDSPITGVVAPDMDRHLKATIDFIWKLQPDLRRLIVVSGASPVDLVWEAAARRVLPAYQDRLDVSLLTGPTLEDLQLRMAQLPAKSAIVLLAMDQDGAGRSLSKSDVLSKLVQTASAPVYGSSIVNLGAGVLGGALVNQETLATETARLIARLIRGERVQDIPIQEGSLTPTVNWRQLQRWNIPEGRIPPGTVIIQRDPSVWELYKWPIIAVLTLCVLEAMLIAALLVHRARRRRAERSLGESKRLLQSTLDALNAQIALLDGTGKIVAVNDSWRRFGEVNGYTGADDGVGRNYLEICESGIRSDESQIVSGALQDLIAGARADFGCIYECGKAAEKSWFQLRINRFYTDEIPWLVMEHENVTEIKKAYDAQQQLTGLLLRAQDDERRRIARDLHDVTVQNVATIKADLMRVRRASCDLDYKVLAKLDEGLALSDQVIRELRTLSYLLHPPLLDEFGLIPALQHFVRGFIERSGIQVEVLVNGDIGRLTADFETTLFRVAQESLSNIHRHSGSPSAIICATKEDAGIVLQISDRGRGIARKALTSRNQVAPPPGVGIMGMAERLRQLGGQLEIDSDDQGTIVTARVSTEATLCSAS